jgi:hypothetical protein
VREKDAQEHLAFVIAWVLGDALCSYFKIGVFSVKMLRQLCMNEVCKN